MQMMQPRSTGSWIRLNLDFVRSEVGEAVHEVTAGMEAPETEAVQETVQMPEGEVQFEISDLDEAFQVGDMDFSEEEKNQNHPEKEFSEPENFIPVQEEGKRICPALPCTAEIFLPGRKKGLMQGRGNRSVQCPPGAGEHQTGESKRNPRSGAGKRTVDQRKRRREQK